MGRAWVADRMSDKQDNGGMVLDLRGPVTRAVCERILQALEEGVTRADIDFYTLVIGPDASGFDLRLRDLQPLSEQFTILTDRIATSSKPVVAVLQGHVSDAALDLALCAHARVAERTARVSMPGVELGLLPGGGGTQRLPRLIGPMASAHLLLTAEVWPITDMRLNGLAEIVRPADITSRVRDLAQAECPLPRHNAPDPVAFQAALSDARARFPNPTPAQADIIACLEAAQLLPMEQGLAFEASRFARRAADRQTRLLRHAAFVEDTARHLPMTTKVVAQKVETVVVMGRSSEAADLAAMGLEQGYHVWMEAGSKHLGRALAELTSKRLRPRFRQSDEVKARLGVDLTGAELEEADLIFDTGELTPDPPVTLKEGGVWIVTSHDIAAADRAREVNCEGRALRLRRLLRASQVVELSASPETQDSALVTAHAALSGGGHCVIVTKDRPGGLLGALFCALSRAAVVMLAAGREPGEIEHAARSLGLRQGPLQMIDVLGAGRSLAQMRRVYEHRGVALAPLRLLSDRMSDLTDGDQERARRALVFHAPAGQSFARDPDLLPWLREWREDHADRHPAWPDVDLGDAMLAALVSEAARLMQDSVVERATDVDLAAQKGLMMDRRSGGPLIQADLTGLLRLSRIMARLQDVDHAVWAREPLVVEMVKNGRSFF